MYGVHRRLKATEVKIIDLLGTDVNVGMGLLFTHGGPLSAGPPGAILKLILSIMLSKSKTSWPSMKSHCMTKSHLVFTKGEGEEKSSF